MTVNKKELGIVFGATGNVAFALANVLIGLKKHNANLDADVIIFEQNINSRDKEIIQKIYPVLFKNYSFPKEKVLSIETLNRFTEVAFSRYECFNLLNKYKKVLWLDIDILIQKPLNGLLKEATTGLSLLGGLQAGDDFSIEINGLEKDKENFNTGIMYLQDNLPNYDKLSDWCYQKTVEYAKYLKSADQGIINLMIKEHNIKVHKLPHIFNANPVFNFDYLDAVIVHTYCPEKFWNYWDVREWNENNKKWLKMGGSKYNGKKASCWQRKFKDIPNPIKRPRGFVQYLSKYIKYPIKVGQVDLLKTDASIKSIYSPTNVSYPIPISIDNSDLFIEKNVIIPEMYVATIPNGKVYTKNGIVLSEQGKPIQDFSPAKPHPLGNKRYYKFNKYHKISGSVAVLTNDSYQKNYYHWIIESASRFYLLEKAGITPDFYLIDNECDFQKRILELLGVNANKIIKIEPNRLLKADEVIVPSIINYFETVKMPVRTYYNAKFIPKWVNNFYKDKFLPLVTITDKKRKIYISRENAIYRKVQNEEEVIEFLINNGFDVIHPERLDFLEQVELFANASHVIGLHGAGLTNILFSQENTKILEIFPPDYYFQGQQMIAFNNKLNYKYMVADACWGDYPGFVPLKIEVDKLRKILDI